MKNSVSTGTLVVRGCQQWLVTSMATRSVGRSPDEYGEYVSVK